MVLLPEKSDKPVQNICLLFEHFDLFLCTAVPTKIIFCLHTTVLWYRHTVMCCSLDLQSSEGSCAGCRRRACWFDS